MFTSEFRSAVAPTVVVIAVAMLAAACGRTVSVPEPSPAPEVARLCRALHDRLPDELDGQRRRPTQPASQLVAVWGAPPVALRCGVGRPTGLRPTSHLVTVNGVDWLPEPAEAPTRFTAVHRAAYVQVILPADGVPAANVLVDLAEPVRSTIPPAQPGS